MPPKKLPPFRHGAKIMIKKGNIPAIIQRAVGAKLWEVEHVDARGRPNGIISQLKSQQMKNLTNDAEFPTEDQRSVGSNSSDTSELDTNDPVRNLDEAGQPNEFIELFINQNGSDQSHDGTHSSTSIDLRALGDGSIIRVLTANDWDMDLRLRDSDQSAHFVEEDSSVEEDPDEELDEDIPYTHPQDVDDPDAFNAADFMAARGIEVDQNKHKAKWDRYVMEKQALIANEWSVACKAPKKQSLGVGERVEERRDRRRKGIIVGDDRNHEDDTGPLWAVFFDGSEEPEHNISSQKLQIVKDTRIFTWKVVIDSTPRAADTVVKAKTLGVAGFNFREAFEDAATACNSLTYRYPFLMLLIHLWPGNWQVHLRNLNIAIEVANASRSKRGLNKKVVSFVSGESQHAWTNSLYCKKLFFRFNAYTYPLHLSLRKGMVDYLGRHFCSLPMP